MAANDIGIDLGTATVLIYQYGKGIILKEPSVIAVNTNDNKVLAVGEEAHKMLGRTPGHIRAVRPMNEGVISDYETTEQMIKYFIKKACGSSLVKPRVAICVPSAVTEVESRAVIDVAINAGARKVYLIEEPVAAAIGSGIDISKPMGHIVLDIGGGTSDIALLSLNGIVHKKSVKFAGNKFDEAIIKAVKDKYNLLIGEKMAEKIKKEIGSVYYDASENLTMEVKGRNLLTGMPEKLTVCRDDVYPNLMAVVQNIITALRQVLERTPPELMGDIYTNGLLLTGGGSLIHGLGDLIEENTYIKTYLSDNPIECVAIGTGLSFDYLDKLVDGFSNRSIKEY